MKEPAGLVVLPLSQIALALTLRAVPIEPLDSYWSVIVVPPQLPLEHVSDDVQESPSLQLPPTAG